MKNNCNKPAAPIENASNKLMEHYTLYPLPDNRKGPDATYCRKSITLDSGEVLVFEFDFVPCAFWDDLENHIPHNANGQIFVDVVPPTVKRLRIHRRHIVRFGNCLRMQSGSLNLNTINIFTINTMEQPVYLCDNHT